MTKECPKPGREVSSAPTWLRLRKEGFCLPKDVLSLLPERRPGRAVNIIQLLEQLCVRIEAINEGSPHGGALVDLECGVALIRAATGQGRGVGRFTIAHDLGHIMLHRTGEYLHTKNTCGGVEQEADEYASAILMPKSEVELLLQAAIGRVSRLEVVGEVVRRYAVSPVAAEVRVARVLRGRGW